MVMLSVRPQLNRSTAVRAVSVTTRILMPHVRLERKEYP
jgi:hypothetical protein